MQRAKNTTVLAKKNGKTGDIINAIIKTYNSTYEQVNEFSKGFLDSDILHTCSNLFSYVVDNIAYRADAFGVQLVKTPARTFSDQFADCKSMAIFTASCLRCLGIRHTIRFAAYSKINNDPTHVYVIAYDEQGAPIIMDTVLKKFNQEVPYTSKTDMAGTDIYYLAGIGESTDTLYLGESAHYKSREEIDLFVNLNILNNQFRDALKKYGDNSIEAARVLDRVDLAMLAIKFYELNATSTVNVDALLSGLLLLTESGQLNYSDISTATDDNTGRASHFNDLYTYILGNASTFAMQGNAHEQINHLTGNSLYVADLKTLGWVYPTIEGFGKYKKRFAAAVGGIDAATQDKCIQDIVASIEYYAYSFIADADISLYPAVVGEKRTFHIDLLNKWNEAGVMTREQSAKVIISELDRKYGLTPVAYLNAIRNGIFRISGIPGTDPHVGLAFLALIAIISAIVSLLESVVKLVQSVIPSESTVKYNAPINSDLAKMTSTITPSTSGITTLGTSSSSTSVLLYAGIGLAAFMLLKPNKHGKDKK